MSLLWLRSDRDILTVMWTKSQRATLLCILTMFSMYGSASAQGTSSSSSSTGSSATSENGTHCYVHTQYQQTYDFRNNTRYHGADWRTKLEENGLFINDIPVAFGSTSSFVPAWQVPGAGSQDVNRLLVATRIAEQGETGQDGQEFQWTIDTARIPQFQGVIEHAVGYLFQIQTKVSNLYIQPGGDRSLMAFSVYDVGGNVSQSEVGTPVYTKSVENVQQTSDDEVFWSMNEEELFQTTLPDPGHHLVRGIFQNQGIRPMSLTAFQSPAVTEISYIQIAPCFPFVEPVCGNGSVETSPIPSEMEQCDCGSSPCPILNQYLAEPETSREAFLAGLSEGDRKEFDRCVSIGEEQDECWSATYWDEILSDDWQRGGQFLHNDNVNFCNAKCKKTQCGDALLQTGAGETCELEGIDSNTQNFPDTLFVDDTRLLQNPMLLEEDPNANGADIAAAWAKYEGVRLAGLPYCFIDEILDWGVGFYTYDRCVAKAGNTVTGIPPNCGDGKIDTDTEPPEQCDCGSPESTNHPCAGQIPNGERPTSLCSLVCQLPYCGDGIIQSWNDEICDAGTLNVDPLHPPANVGRLGRVCYASCAPYVCGDKRVDNLAGEQCDNGYKCKGYTGTGLQNVNGVFIVEDQSDIVECDNGQGAIAHNDDKNCNEVCLKPDFLARQRSLWDRFRSGVSYLAEFLDAGIQWIEDSVIAAWDFAWELIRSLRQDLFGP